MQLHNFSVEIFTEYKAETFLEKKGFPVVKRELFTDAKKALEYASKIGFPVVLKLASDELLHKTDVNAVRLNVHNDEFMKEFASLSRMKIKHYGVIVQKFIHGKFIIIGIKKDETFGHVILVGLGGIFAEIINDTSFRVLPITKKDAFEMLKELRSFEILRGYRGEKVNLNHVVDIMLKVSKLTDNYPNILELDLNPLIANEKKALIVDARIIFDNYR